MIWENDPKEDETMKLNVSAFEAFDKDWALLTAGSVGEGYNTMTISWGGLGTLWGKPVATVYVKPIRYTHEFLDANEYFTVSFYPEEYKKALGLLGSRSGRDGDKVAAAGLTPAALEGAVTFQEAKLTLLCKKIDRQDMDTSAMPAAVVDAFYTKEAPHTMYIGEVVEILGQP